MPSRVKPSGNRTIINVSHVRLSRTCVCTEYKCHSAVKSDEINYTSLKFLGSLPSDIFKWSLLWIYISIVTSNLLHLKGPNL